MIPEAYKPFLQKIIEKTNNDEVKWEKTSEKTYVLRSKSSTIEIGYYTDLEAEVGYYYFKFFSINKKTNAGFRINHLEEDYYILEKLYAVAEASASDIKDKLSSFLDEL